MGILKKFAIVASVAVVGAFGASTALASTFTYSATGSLSGKAVSTQVFKTTAGNVECGTAETSGVITSTNFTEQHLTVGYKNCKAFGFVGVDISPATYLLTADGTTHIKGAITINVTAAGCHQTLASQTGLGTVAYTNLTGGKLGVDANLSKISWTGSGGFCGTGGSEGTYTGNNQVERVGGGSISWDK